MDTFKVTFTPDKLAAFKDAIKQAETVGEEVFEFQGKQWLLAYAKYLAEYLTGTFMALEMQGRPVEYGSSK